MANDWISIRQAYEKLLFIEGNEVLVRRMLSLFLWTGELPAISRRAFVDGELVNDLAVVTEKDWPLKDSPILFDWRNSTGVLPKGFFRPTRDAQCSTFEFTEYYRIEISENSFRHKFPSNGGAPEPEVSIMRTGVVGAPTSRDLVEAEIRRRISAGERFKTKTDAAKSLAEWLVKTYQGKAPRMTWKAMMNSQSLSSQLREVVNPSAEIIPKSRP